MKVKQNNNNVISKIQNEFLKLEIAYHDTKTKEADMEKMIFNILMGIFKINKKVVTIRRIAQVPLMKVAKVSKASSRNEYLFFNRLFI